MGSGYFLRGFADGFQPGLMGGNESKLAREKFNYQKERDTKADVMAKWLYEQQQKQAGLDEIRTEQATRDAELKNKEYYGMRNTLARGLMDSNPDSWMQKEYFNSGDDGRGRTLPEMEYLTGLRSTEDTKNLFGIKTPTSTIQDPSVLTARANIDNAKAGRLFDKKEYKLKLADTMLKDKKTAERDLRKETNAMTATFNDGTTAYKKLKGLAKRAIETDAPAATMGMIFTYMKMLDPTSVVRESEYRSAEAARGLPDFAKNIWNKIIAGERVSPEQIGDFVRSAEVMYSSMRESYEHKKEQYRSIAADGKLKFSNIWIDSKVVDPFSIDKKKEEKTDKKPISDLIKEVDASLGKL